MIDFGGNNLPKAISSKSDAKLGKIYKNKGLPLKIEDALYQIYRVLKAKPKILRIDDNTFEIIINYPKKFCSIGGSNNPSYATLFQENVCIPYTRDFLNELFPNYKFESDILSCIPLNNHRTCHYVLKLENRANP